MNNGWTGVVLAGGKSSRMGRDKALIAIDGRSLLDRALDTLQPVVNDLLVIGDPMKYGHVGPFVIADEIAGKGPIGGIVTAMRYSSNDNLLVIACDMPNIDRRLLERLKSELGNFTDAVVPQDNDRAEPLCAAYHRRCENAFRKAIAEDELKMQDVLKNVRTSFISIEDGTDLFRNLNTPDDLL